MNRLRVLVYTGTLALAAYTFGSFSIVADETFSMALYCGKDCRYPLPYNLGAYDLWTTWTGIFTVIAITFFTGLATSYELGRNMANPPEKELRASQVIAAPSTIPSQSPREIGKAKKPARKQRDYYEA